MTSRPRILRRRRQAGLPRDCVLSLGDPDAIAWSVPSALADACAASGGAPDPLRAWTTCLCVSALMTLNETYLLDRDFTIADNGFQWLEEQGLLHPRFGAVLGQTLASAKEQVLCWERYHVRARAAAAGADCMCGPPHAWPVTLLTAAATCLATARRCS